MTAVSIVVPLYNEEEVLPVLYGRLKSIMDGLRPGDYELVLVDDGSRDATWSLIESYARQDKAVKGVRLSRNFGQQNALTAGLDASCGNAVIMMDGDMQHPPELIAQMLDKWKEGYDIVYTKRAANEGYGFVKQGFSSFFAFVFNRLSTIEVQEGVLDFRLISRQVVDELKNLKERCRFFRGLVSWVGFKSTFITYTAPKRVAGKTKYSFGRSLSLAFTALVSFSPKPLYLASIMGLAVTFASAVYIMYALYVKFFTPQPLPGWASILVSVLFLGGIQLIAIGILGSYLGMVYEEVKARPSYVIQQKVGFNA